MVISFSLQQLWILSTTSTDEKKMNTALQSENEILRDKLQSLTNINKNLSKNQILFDQAEKLNHLGHWEWDEIAECYITCSEQYAKIFGKTSAQMIEEITSCEDILELVCEEDRERFKKVTELAFAKKQAWNIEYCSYKAGKRIYIKETGQPVLDEYGLIVRTVGSTQDITEQRQGEEALQQSHTLFKQAEALGNMGHFCWDLVAEKLISCSDQYARIFDMTVNEALDYFISIDAVNALIFSEDKVAYRQSQYFYTGRPKGSDIEYRVTTHLGNKRHISSHRRISHDINGLPLLLFGTILDITDKKEKELALSQATDAAIEANAQLVFQKNALDQHAIVSTTDLKGNITYANDRFCTISGYDREELLGQNHRIIKSDVHSKEVYETMWKTISSGNTWQGEIKSTNKTGNSYWTKTTIVATLDDKGKPFQFVAIRTEITERKQAEENLKHIAHYDLLTNLPNRVLLADRLNQDMAQCKRRNQTLVVAFLDLDGFKAVNDSHGHTTGDELLVILSTRMKEALREGDTLARIGGDEFIAIMVDLEKTEDKKPVLERLLKAASEPVTVGDAVIQVSVSIGVTIYPQDGEEADQLTRRADQAMYFAKQAGKNRFHLFDKAQDDALKVRREEINGILSALSNNEFVLYYQPKVNMQTGELIGVEALIRWMDPIRGLVPPLDFLPIIEGHAASVTLGEWVINTALAQISQWRNQGIKLPISVNISTYQLQQDNFANRLIDLLADHPSVQPHYLELEILETSELSDIDQVFDTMNICHALGVRFALDDFGTGYSSLTHLRRLPAYLIKIDKSFVLDMLEDTDDLAIVDGVIGLAKTFKREVIAEGVETIEHGEALLKLGCKLAQGYCIAHPMHPSNIPEWISNWKVDDTWQA